MRMHIGSSVAAEPFLAASYRGRHIAAFQNGRGWLAYLDRVMETGKVFATAQDATHWLQHRIDDPNFDSRPWLTRPLRSRAG